MDSDNSLDGELEIKHEVSAKPCKNDDNVSRDSSEESDQRDDYDETSPVPFQKKPQTPVSSASEEDSRSDWSGSPGQSPHSQQNLDEEKSLPKAEENTQSLQDIDENVRSPPESFGSGSPRPPSPDSHTDHWPSHFRQRPHSPDSYSDSHPYPRRGPQSPDSHTDPHFPDSYMNPDNPDGSASCDTSQFHLPDEGNNRHSPQSVRSSSSSGSGDNSRSPSSVHSFQPNEQGPHSPDSHWRPRSPDTHDDLNSPEPYALFSDTRRGPQTPDIGRGPQTPDSLQDHPVSPHEHIGPQSPNSGSPHSPASHQDERSPACRRTYSPESPLTAGKPKSFNIEKDFEATRTPDSRDDSRFSESLKEYDYEDDESHPGIKDFKRNPSTSASEETKISINFDNREQKGDANSSIDSDTSSKKSCKRNNKSAEGIFSSLHSDSRDSTTSTDMKIKSLKKSNFPSVEDLSDVSDLDSNDCDGLNASDSGEQDKLVNGIKGWKSDTNVASRTNVDSLEEVEQLDFEADDQQEKEEEKEEGECDAGDDKSDEGELKEEELEEGEITDDDENRPEETEPRPVCRFYSRGQCFWGINCRFIHPGVTDKGNYTMFDTMVNPLVPFSGPPMGPPVDYRPAYDKPPNYAYTAPRKEESTTTPAAESAWERGLRQAKEMIKKSSKRKETDTDFEEKKMNLTLSQEEAEKENDYYTRQPSPVVNEEEDRFGRKTYNALDDDDRFVEEDIAARERYDKYESFRESAYYHQSRNKDYRHSYPYESSSARNYRSEIDYTGSGRSKYYSTQRQRRPSSPDYYDKYDKYDKKKKSRSSREVIVQRVEKSHKGGRRTETSSSKRSGRGDEWSDPWMRSKSPTSRKPISSRSRRKTYSSASSYSSSSSSRSSSQSSYSSYSKDSRSRSRSKSYSHSRSKSRSRSRSHSKSHSKSRSSPFTKKRRPLVPTARGAKERSPMPLKLIGSPNKKGVPELRASTRVKPSPVNTSGISQMEKKAASERALLMNPPAPTPRKPKEVVKPPSPDLKKLGQNPPAPVPPPSLGAVKAPSGLKMTLDRPKVTVPGEAAIKANMRSRSASSHSSSDSESSRSSSESSGSSYSSSSSSRERSPSPKVVRPQKRIVIDERERLALAQSMKVKAMDALKLSGQKQQIKLTLKTTGGGSAGSSASGVAAIAANTLSTTPTRKPIPGSGGLPELPELNIVRRDRAPAPVAGKKRPAEEMTSAEQLIAAKMAATAKPSAKKPTSRREELLKQLKAVEDAIARKRSKV